MYLEQNRNSIPVNQWTRKQVEEHVTATLSSNRIPVFEANRTRVVELVHLVYGMMYKNVINSVFSIAVAPPYEWYIKMQFVHGVKPEDHREWLDKCFALCDRYVVTEPGNYKIPSLNNYDIEMRIFLV